MSIATIRTIARREVRDTITDWRILMPIFILTFVLPQLLVAASSLAIRYINDDASVIRLIPFAMLLVGFIPASFSLITALESFVGERERNSLESLLSMPISDAALYIGKLISSALPPLMSALLAMSIFAISLRLRFPALFEAGLSLESGILVFLLIITKTVVMVAGAVVISSHTSSIRAANLLASFILLPTATAIQLEALVIIAQRWDILWMVAALFVVIATALIRTGLGSFNREEILSREHEQFQLKRVSETFKKFFREYQPAGTPPDLYQNLPFSVARFYRTELPALLREYRLPIGVAVVSALSGLLLGGYIGQTYRVPMLQGYLDNVGNAPQPGLGLALFIFFNNIRVSLLSALLSLFVFGAFAFLVPAVAFAQIGFVSQTLAQSGGNPLAFLLGYVLPHGVIELPTAILGAALGLRIGVSLLSPPPGFSVGQNIMWSIAQFLKIWLLVLIPLFLFGSLIEGLVTPVIIQALYRS